MHSQKGLQIPTFLPSVDTKCSHLSKDHLVTCSLLFLSDFPLAFLLSFSFVFVDDGESFALTTMTSFRSTLALLLLAFDVTFGFVPSLQHQHHHQQKQNTQTTSSTILRDYADDSSPSDYDTVDLPPDQREAIVDENEEDALIRDELKRELLLLASVTNRGEYASSDERGIVIDLVTQLEALNPTADPAARCEGEWDLCLSSTQFFRSSPFFLSIRAAAGDENRNVAENFFDLHDKATSGSRVGKVRQSVKSDSLVSEVDLEVGVPGLPMKMKGTVITSASLKVTSSDKWELKVQNTKVSGSNIPLLNQLMEDQLQVELPVGDFYNTVQGDIPTIEMSVSEKI